MELDLLRVLPRMPPWMELGSRGADLGPAPRAPPAPRRLLQPPGSVSPRRSSSCTSCTPHKLSPCTPSGTPSPESRAQRCAQMLGGLL